MPTMTRRSGGQRSSGDEGWDPCSKWRHLSCVRISILLAANPPVGTLASPSAHIFGRQRSSLLDSCKATNLKQPYTLPILLSIELWISPIFLPVSSFFYSGHRAPLSHAGRLVRSRTASVLSRFFCARMLPSWLRPSRDLARPSSLASSFGGG